VNFKYSSKISDQKEHGISIFDWEAQKLFKNNASSITGFNLLIGQDSKTKLAMALALTRENISVVNIEDVYKVVVTLSCNVTFLDFDGMKVVATYPIYLEYIDVQQSQPDENYKINLVKKLFFADDFSIFKILKDRLGNISLKNEAVLTMKLLNVNLGDEAKDKLTMYKDNFGAFESLLAQRFSDALSSKLNVSVLPYAKDYLGGKMALSFSDARTVEFQIPTASYSIDLTLRKLTKELYKAGIGDDAFLFGAYTTVKIYDPDLGKTYWEQKIKYGAVKNIPKLQKTTDDYSVFDEMTGLAMAEIMKKIKEDKPLYKEVITRCLNK
ncbi:MAG: hypothetical protein WCH62_08805, partial [Candidatus Omnitrophota bacterium]